MELRFKITFDEETVSKLNALPDDLRAAAFSEFGRVVQVTSRQAMARAIYTILPRCVRANSVVHKQHGGRVYNKRCPKCGVPLIGRKKERDQVTGKRWVFYIHPDTPLEGA